MNVLFVTIGGETVILVYWLAVFLPNLAVTRPPPPRWQPHWMVHPSRSNPPNRPTLSYCSYTYQKEPTAPNNYGPDPLGPEDFDDNPYKFQG